MNDFYFEIVRRSRKHYDWVFVAVRDGRPRVLARSGREYRSRKKVRRAIAKLQYAFPHADVRSVDPFRLPHTRFEIVPGVLPLRVQAAPTRSVHAGRRHAVAGIGPAEAPEPQARQAEPEEQRAEHAGVAETPAEPEQKPVTAGRRRRAT